MRRQTSAQGRYVFTFMGSKTTQSLGLNCMTSPHHSGNQLTGWLIQEKRKGGGEKKKKKVDFPRCPSHSKVKQNFWGVDSSMPLVFLGCILKYWPVCHGSRCCGCPISFLFSPLQSSPAALITPHLKDPSTIAFSSWQLPPGAAGTRSAHTQGILKMPKILRP